MMNFGMMTNWSDMMGNNFWLGSFGFFWWLVGIEVVVLLALAIVRLWQRIKRNK